MKVIQKILISVAVCAVSVGCTQNNGEIDPWFGFWRLTDLTADGKTVEEYEGNMVWSFQNNIVCMTTTYGVHERTDSWGTWSDGDGILMLDFGHYDDTGSSMYDPPAILRLSDETPNRLDIVSQSSRHMQLSWVDDEGTEMGYYLEKVY